MGENRPVGAILDTTNAEEMLYIVSRPNKIRTYIGHTQDAFSAKIAASIQNRH